MAGSYAAFAHHDFRCFQAARLLYGLSLQMQGVAIAAHIYERTGRPLDLGLVGLSLFAPAAILSLVTGHAADRYDRRRILLMCFGALSVCSAVLFLLVRAELPVIWPFYVVLVLIGTSRAFLGPAAQSLLVHLVPMEDFPNAVAWSSSIGQAAMALGPAVGGLFYDAVATPDPVFATCSGLFALSFASTALVRVRPGRRESKAVSLETLLAGAKYVWSNKILLGAISLDLFAVLLGGAVALLKPFATILGAGNGAFGVMRCMPAAGAMLMAVVLAHRPVRRRAGATMFACVALFGVATIGLGLARSVPVALVALLVIGATDMVSVYVRQTLVQLTTPDEMRGRVSAVNLVFIGASNELGEFESGATADWWGVIPAIIVGGAGTIAVVALWAVLFPSLRKVDRLAGR